MASKFFTYVIPKIAKNLSTKRAIQDKVVAAIERGTKAGLKGATPSQSLKQSTRIKVCQKNRENEIRKF